MIKLKIKADLLCYVARFMSTDDTRYNLKGVCFTPERSIVATDGHRMGVLNNAFELLGDSDSIPQDGFILYIDKNLLKVLKAQKNSELEIAVEGAGARIVAGAMTLNANLIDATFPEYKKVIPEHKAENKINWIAFNPKYLADFGGYKKDDRIKLEFSDDEKCPFFVFNSELPDFVGVLMPVRW